MNKPLSLEETTAALTVLAGEDGKTAAAKLIAAIAKLTHVPNHHHRTD